MNIIGNKRIFLTISAILIAAALAAIGRYGFREGIEFGGGVLWRVGVPGGGEMSASRVEETLKKTFGIDEVRVTAEEKSSAFLLKLPPLSEEEHRTYADKLSAAYPGFEEHSFQSIGPSVGAELRKKSLMSIALVLLGISLYIAFAFRKITRPISSWKYGWVTLMTLFHDVIIPAGLLAVLGHYARVEIDGNFVVALLVVAGFSVHDTIVVFDRIRENLILDRGKTPFSGVVNTSINQTLARSINTSLTLVLVLIALYVTGPASLKYFILTMLVGVTTGIYSSIFVASPLLIVWQNIRGTKPR